MSSSCAYVGSQTERPRATAAIATSSGALSSSRPGHVARGTCASYSESCSSSSRISKKARGVLTFRGFVDQPNRGIVEYTDGDGATAKGRWVIKPYRITRLVAEWNLRFDGGAPSRAGERHQYRGFVSVDRSFGGERPDAQIVGDVVDLEDSKYGLRRETRIGTFEADLIELFDSEKKL